MYQHNSFGVLVKELGTTTYKYLNKLVVPSGKVSADGELDLTGAFADGIVSTYAELADPTTAPNQLWYVETSTGVWLVNYHSSGWYYSDGTNWILMPDSTTASKTKYDNRDATLTSTTVKTALDEEDDKVEGHVDGLSRNHTLSHILLDNSIGTLTHLGSYYDVYSHMYSAGVVDGGELTDNLDGTVNIAAGEALLRPTGGTPHSSLIPVAFSGVTNIALTNNATNFIYLDYNSGTPTVAVTTNSTTVNMLDKVAMHVAVREGTKLSHLDVLDQNVDHIARNQIKEYYTEAFKRKNGGMIISDAGTLHLSCDGGAFFFQLNEYSVPALDTTGTDTFEYYYRDGVGGWIESDQQVIDNLYYDDGTGTLALLNNNKFGVHWIYAIVGSNPHYAVVYGQAEYDKLADAGASFPPSIIPPSVSGVGTLLGRAIVEKSALELTTVESVYSTVFSSSLALTHNGLAGLQGGTLDEYYHMTALQYSRISTDGAFYLASPTTDGTYRFIQDAGELKIQKRVSGVWQTAAAFDYIP